MELGIAYVLGDDTRDTGEIQGRYRGDTGEIQGSMAHVLGDDTRASRY